MSLFNTVKALFRVLFPVKEEKEESGSIYSKDEVLEEVHSLWDYIKFNSQSQAFHICNVLGFEEWTSMDEVLRRIKEIFGVYYKNERSLYPYIKTLVDCGLLETSGFSGKKHWRKSDLLIKVEEKRSKVELSKQIKTPINNN